MAIVVQHGQGKVNDAKKCAILSYLIIQVFYQENTAAFSRIITFVKITL